MAQLIEPSRKTPFIAISNEMISLTSKRIALPDIMTLSPSLRNLRIFPPPRFTSFVPFQHSSSIDPKLEGSCHCRKHCYIWREVMRCMQDNDDIPTHRLDTGSISSFWFFLCTIVLHAIVK